MHNQLLNSEIKNKINQIDIDFIGEIFKILGDKTKIKILIALLDEKKCVHDLCDIVESTQSNTSHALSKMKSVHILKEEKNGKHVFYEIYDNHIRELIKIILTHMEECYEKNV